MQKLTIQELQKIINRKYRGNGPHLSNLWKEDKKRVICLGLYTSNLNVVKSFYTAHIEMDYSGKVLRVCEQKESCSKLEELIGQTIDLNSFNHDYQKRIHDRPVGVESSYLVGHVDKNGRAKIFNKKSLASFKFPKEYRTNGDKLEEFGNFKVVALFQSILKKYSDSIQSFQIFRDGITYYTVILEINGLKVTVELQQFFFYNLIVSIYSPRKNPQTDLGTAIVLKDMDAEDFDKTLEEIQNRKLSKLTKTRILSMFRGVRFVEISEYPDKVVASVHFDGNEDRPKGMYPFVFDFKNKKVQCNQRLSKKFIPEKVRRLNENLKDYEKHNYYF